METILRTAAYVFYALVALLLVGAILIQEGKGGGLAALGGTRAETAFGASNPIRRLTVALAIIFFLLAGVLSWWLPRQGGGAEGTRVTAPGELGAAEEPGGETVAPPEVPPAPAEEPAGEAGEPDGAEAAEAAEAAAPAERP